MKKSKLSIGLVASFIAAMALSACDHSVTKNSSNIVNFTGYDDKPLQVVTDDIYDDYMKSASGISKYYDQVIEVLIRNIFDKSQKDATVLPGVKKNYNRIVNEAKDNVKGAKQTAKENAETNGTSYKKEWEAILTQQGVEDEEELLQHYIYQLEKEEIEDWYFEQNKADLKKEYLGVNKDGTAVASEVTSRFPYHVRHILVKADADSSEQFTRGTISFDQAKLLSNIVDKLAKGFNTFGDVAEKLSEDSSSSSYGDVGIMTNAITSGKLGMVNEFQLGIYAYDAVLKNKNTSEVVDKGLGLDKDSEETAGAKTVKKYFTDRGIAEVPFSVFKELGDVAEIEENENTGLPVEDGKAALYPRNLLWNRYLNNHSIFVITNGKRPVNANIHDNSANDEVDMTSSAEYFTGVDTSYTPKEGAINYASLSNNDARGKHCGFGANANFTGTNEQVLTDENGNVIIGVRSEYGIHLMIVQKSAYGFADEVSLEDYYTTANPGDSDYPTKDGKDLETYVNFIKSNNNSDYDTRSKTVKTAIKGFDGTYDYRLYELLSFHGNNAKREETFGKDSKSLELLDLIDDYIEVQREKNREEQSDGLEDVWQTYVQLLEIQDHYRKTLKRTLPEGCKIAFSSNVNMNEDEAFKEGGKCYVK